MALTPGAKLGPYEIIAPLGAGGMGEVYRARDLQLGRDVAIKVLPSFVSRDPDRLRRFEQEARAAAALNHPNILAVYQMGTYEGAPYLVSELLEGSTLREHLVGAPLQVRKVIDYGVQIARGLAAAHEQGVAHRDLKPENLFVTKHGQVKIIDFGLAKLTQRQTVSDQSAPTVSAETEPGAVMGTVGYMAPEQVRGKTADHRADIFSFGAILYEMISGKRTFQKPTSAETMSAILNEDPPGISQLAPATPPALQRVVHRCLEKNPEQRFQSASDLAFALEALSDSREGSRVVGHANSQPRLKWIALLLGAIALAAGVLVWWNLPPGVPQIIGATQLSNDGLPKQALVGTDGSRIYFNEGAAGSWRIAEISVAGGETNIVPTSVVDPQLLALAPDGSALLALSGEVGWSSLWVIPLPTGEPRRLNTMEAQDASFFPDGRLLFAHGTGVYSADKDGSNAHMLFAAPDDVFCPIVSPSGKALVFSTKFSGDSSYSLIASSMEGSNQRTLFEGTKDSFVHCARWVSDERELLFRVTRRGRDDIWTVSRQPGLLHSRSQPVQLTNGPISYSGITPSIDRKRIFAIGTLRRGELVRYDLKSQQFVPFLSGISAIDPTFSLDGQWVAYTSYPDHTLWRSRVDGSDRLQLTYPPSDVAYPFISPDGKKVCFRVGTRVYVTGMDGGSLRKVVDKDALGAQWSPDSNSLVVTRMVPGKHSGDANYFELFTFDLTSGRTAVVPSSQGKLGTWWLANNTLVGVTDDLARLVSFDLKTAKWAELVSDSFVYWAPSLDSKYMYYTTGGPAPKVMRIRLTDHRLEEITSLKGFRNVVDPTDSNTPFSVAPDGSPVFTRDIGTQEIYALDVKWP